MEFFIYLSKSAAILLLFYLVYIMVLRKDTFFTANRFYLLSGILAALVLPLLTFTQTVYVEVPATTPVMYTTISDGEMLPSAATSAPAINWWYIASLTYIIGIVYMLGQVVFRLRALIRVLRKYPSKRHNGFFFVQVGEAMAPFSFFNYIVYNPKYHSEEELQMILQHEQIHASQWHSFDVLLAHILRAVQWLNPISWWYKKSLEANLEYIADDQTAHQVPSKEAYQLALVKASSALQTPVLSTNFYQSFTRLQVFGREINLNFQNGQVKKRIIMLNKNQSNKYNRLKLSLIVPVLGLFLWSFNTHEVVEYVETPSEMDVMSTSTAPLLFSAESTNGELDDIENYLAKNHPTSLVKIANRKRNAEGVLTQFSFKTKFEGNERFITRFDRLPEHPFVSIYEILPQNDGSLIVNELGEKGVQLLISKENLKISTLTTINDANAQELKTTSEEEEQGLGENPLYIINNKSIQQDELPEHSEIRLDGTIKSYSKKEGLQKYGAKGKDGVLHFDGVSTFVNTRPAQENATPKVSAQGTVINTRTQNLANINPPVLKQIKFPITKNTTNATLDAYTARAKNDYGYDVSFTVNRNANNEITGIQIAYTSNGNSGNISSNNGGPIADSYFYIDDETGGAGFVNEGSEERMEEMRERMEVRRAQMEERRQDRREVRSEAVVRRKALLEESRKRREGLFHDSTQSKSKLFKEHREILQEEREELRERRKEMRKKHAMHRDSLLGQVNHFEHEREDEVERHIAHTNTNGNNFTYANSTVARTHHDASDHAIVIDKNTTDTTLATMKSNLAQQGIDFNYKRVRRNSRGEITSIKLTIDNNKGSKITKSVSSDDDEPIETVLLKI